MYFKDVHIPDFGFTAADPTTSIPRNAMITGSQNLMYRGIAELESIGGFERTLYGGGLNAGGDISQIVGKGYAIIGDGAGEGAGNITEFVGRTLWFTGVGDITVFMPGITAAPQALGNSPLQNNIPQVVTLNESKTGYTTPFQVGLLDQLTAPTLLVSPTALLSKLNGTYAVQLTWFRDATGAESLPSPPSNVVQFSNQTGILQFPTSTNPVNPRDRWRVFCTPTNFGTVGGFFFFTEVPERRVSTETGAGYAVESGVGNNIFRRNPTVSGFFSSEQVGKRLIFRDVSNVIIHTATITGVTTNTFTIKGVTYGDKVTFTPAFSSTLTNTTHNWSIDSFVTAERQIQIEWFDNELLPIFPPIDAFPPATTASFIAALGNVMILIGTEDGLGIAVSSPNFPEAYPPEFRQNLPEAPVGVLSRPQDRFIYVICQNSVHELMWTGAVVGSPIAPRTVSDQVGAAGQRAACLAGNDIYLFTTSGKPARILANGIIDVDFGNRVEALTKTWDETKVSVSYDEQKNYVAYIHAQTMLMYYPATDVWTPPVVISAIETNGRTSGDILSAFTLKGIIHVSALTGGGAINLYTWDRDMNNVDLVYTSDWKSRFSFTDYGQQMQAKTLTKSIVGMKSSNTTHTLRFFRNYNLSVQMGGDKTFTALGPSGNHINNIIDLNHGEGQLISTELSGNSSRAKIYFVQVEGFTYGIPINFAV